MKFQFGYNSVTDQQRTAEESKIVIGSFSVKYR